MSKTDNAHETRKPEIHSGAFYPDEALTVATLTARHGFGWTPLRDSLSPLEGESPVSLVRNGGYRVVGAIVAELRDIQRARLTIETEHLRVSIRKSDDERQKRVLSAYRVLLRAPALQTGMTEAEHETFEVAHQEFHFALVGGSDCLWLGRFLEQFYAQVRRHQRLVVLGRAPLSDPHTDVALLTTLHSASAMTHRTRLKDAVLDPDERRAVGLLQDHIGTAQVAPRTAPAL